MDIEYICDVHLQDHNRLSVQIPQRREVKLVMQWYPDSKVSPRALDENPIPTIYHWILRPL